MNKSLTAVLVSLLCLSAPAHAQQAAPALDKVIMEFVNAFNARDLAKVSSVYADDAVWMRADSPMIKGRAAIAAELTRRYQGPGVLTLTGTMSGTSGSLAFVAATYTVTVPLEDGGQVSVPAKSLTVFKRVGNAWKIAYDTLDALHRSFVELQRDHPFHEPPDFVAAL